VAAGNGRVAYSYWSHAYDGLKTVQYVEHWVCFGGYDEGMSGVRDHMQALFCGETR
jgi:hypothetical protein